MFILPPDLEEDAANGATELVRSHIVSRGGEVRSLEVWGRRRLAFPIDRYREGVYHIARFSLGPDQTLELDRSLRLNERVLRHMIVLTD